VKYEARDATQRTAVMVTPRKDAAPESTSVILVLLTHDASSSGSSIQKSALKIEQLGPE